MGSKPSSVGLSGEMGAGVGGEGVEGGVWGADGGGWGRCAGVGWVGGQWGGRPGLTWRLVSGLEFRG